MKLGASLLALAALSGLARADRLQSSWNRNVPALSSDGKTVALPVRARFWNWVTANLTASVVFMPVGASTGSRVELFQATAKPGCAALDTLAGDPPPPDAEVCKVSSKTVTPFSTLSRRLAQGRYRTLPIDRHENPFEVTHADLAVSVRVTPDGYIAELSRHGAVIASRSGRAPEPSRAASDAGPASRVVLDGIDAVFPSEDVAYVRLAWTDALNGGKVGFGSEEWLPLAAPR